MTVDTARLKLILDEEGVDPGAYSLDGGMPNEAYALERQSGSWAVYYSERGLRTGEITFESEEDACLHLLELLTRDPTTKRQT